MMSQWGYGSSQPKYSSYKNEYFNKYDAKIRNLVNNIDQSSLKDNDKIKLKNKLSKILSTK